LAFIEQTMKLVGGFKWIPQFVCMSKSYILSTPFHLKKNEGLGWKAPRLGTTL
jgi:hypothetical protein